MCKRESIRNKELSFAEWHERVAMPSIQAFFEVSGSISNDS